MAMMPTRRRVLATLVRTVPLAAVAAAMPRTLLALVHRRAHRRPLRSPHTFALGMRVVPLDLDAIGPGHDLAG